jgi:hypothetical protein
MQEPPPLLVDQYKVDNEHLRLLKIFHFVMAGLALVGLLFVPAHYAIVNMVLSNPEFTSGGKAQGMTQEQFKSLLPFIYLFYAGFGGLAVLTAIANLLSGLYLKARKHRVFSIVVACLNLLHMPLGSILGAFTLMVLLRDSVRRLYEHTALQSRS